MRKMLLKLWFNMSYSRTITILLKILGKSLVFMITNRIRIQEPNLPFMNWTVMIPTETKTANLITMVF